MPLAWAQSPVGDDRWHRNHGTDKMEGMCRDHSQVWPRVVRRERGGPTREAAGPGRAAPTRGAGLRGRKSQPREEEPWGRGDRIVSPNILWKGGCLIPGVTQRTESGWKGRGVTKGSLSSGSQRGGLVRQ